ncbi:MAG: extracellular solute-binding protein [Tabrizicola sp.]|jgi:spermidine/putrescine transport system substrate-binding protein|nr:extracellular solute-binding protein [Tabrizicola sp.]
MTKMKLALIGAASVLALTMPARAADPELTVLDWAGWEIDGILTDFVAKHGANPTYAFFADDDEAFQRMSSGFQADVVQPCVASLPRYRAAGLIEPWDTSRIPEFANIAPRMLESTYVTDAEGVWFIPTNYAYTAIAYNADEVPAEAVASVQVFANPEFAGRISLPDSTDDVWALAFMATGLTSWNEVTDEQFAAAAAWLRSVHPNVRAYWSDPTELAQLMSSGEVLVAWSWNDTTAILRAENFPIGFNRAPAEGASTWFCGAVNVANAPGSEDKAYDFVNSVLAPSSAPAILEAVGYSSSNEAAMAAIPLEQTQAAFVDPITTPLFPQTPVSEEFRAKMIEEFELIKSGF